MDWEKLRDGITTFGEGVGKGFKRVFGSQTDRVVKGLSPVINEINELEPWAQSLDQEAMRAEVAKVNRGSGHYT